MFSLPVSGHCFMSNTIHELTLTNVLLCYPLMEFEMTYLFNKVILRIKTADNQNFHIKLYIIFKHLKLKLLNITINPVN